MRLRDISAAIFDIDGTLLDSSPMWRDLGERFLQSRGITPQPGLSDILAPMTIEESCRYLPENYPLHDTPDGVRAALLEMISDFYRRECPLRPGAAQLLNALHSRGITLLLATAGDKQLSQAALERLGVFRLFSGIFTCDEFGSKSRPEIFLAAGFPPSECAVFEDSLTAVLTAKSAGFLTAAVCDISEPQQETLRSTADYYRLTPGDYLDLL
ncbi:MAG: HAD family phosphatase [Oscillospiraceae bacterium]|nr:HAD family phosphatase [Oscillospiraceae bacterium]